MTNESDKAPLDTLVESLLFVAGGPLTVGTLANTTQASTDDVAQAVTQISGRLRHGIRLMRQGEEVQLVTAPESAEAVQRLRGTVKPAPLSRAALETLTVVAYRQPVTRAELEMVRGANSDRALQTLLARELVEEKGQRDTLGRPMQYGTGFAFLEYFGLASLADLPPLQSELLPSLEPAVLGFRPGHNSEAASSEDETAS